MKEILIFLTLFPVFLTTYSGKKGRERGEWGGSRRILHKGKPHIDGSVKITCYTIFTKPVLNTDRGNLNKV